MGWLFGWETRKELLDHLLLEALSFHSTSSEHRVVAHACVGNNLWTVCERRFPPAQGRPEHSCRFILLCMMQRAGSPPDWGYKDVDEDMGPTEVSCPLKYLELAPLSEHQGECARAWRLRVREHWKVRHESQELARKLKIGDSFAFGSGTIKCVGFRRSMIVGENQNGTRFLYSRSRIRPVGEAPSPKATAAASSPPAKAETAVIGD